MPTITLVSPNGRKAEYEIPRLLLWRLRRAARVVEAVRPLILKQNDEAAARSFKIMSDEIIVGSHSTYRKIY